MITAKDKEISPIVGNKVIEKPSEESFKFDDELLPFRKPLSIDQMKYLIVKNKTNDLIKYLLIMF